MKDVPATAVVVVAAVGGGGGRSAMHSGRGLSTHVHTHAQLVREKRWEGEKHTFTHARNQATRQAGKHGHFPKKH